MGAGKECVTESVSPMESAYNTWSCSIAVEYTIISLQMQMDGMFNNNSGRNKSAIKDCLMQVKQIH